MENKGLEIRVQSQDWYAGIQMVFFERGFDNKILKIGELLMKEYKEGGLLPLESRITIDNKTAQILMDDLWKCGVRPTEGSGSAGSLKATEKHLDDMRKIAFKELGMEG